MSVGVDTAQWPSLSSLPQWSSLSSPQWSSLSSPNSTTTVLEENGSVSTDISYLPLSVDIRGISCCPLWVSGPSHPVPDPHRCLSYPATRPLSSRGPALQSRGPPSQSATRVARYPASKRSLRCHSQHLISLSKKS